jgi:hypothetical protein
MEENTILLVYIDLLILILGTRHRVDYWFRIIEQSARMGRKKVLARKHKRQTD